MKGLAATPVLTMPEPATSIDRLIQEIYNQVARRAYERFQQRGFAHGNHFDDWLQAEAELFQTAPIHIEEEDDKFVVRAEVPGFRPGQVEVRVEPRRVLISGYAEQQDKQKTRGQTIYTEGRSTQLFRALNLPTEILPEKAQGSLADGVLQIVLPKAISRKGVRLDLKSTSVAA